MHNLVSLVTTAKEPRTYRSIILTRIVIRNSLHLNKIKIYLKILSFFVTKRARVFGILTSMKTSWNGNSFHITGPLWGESTGHRCIPFTKGPVMQSFDVFVDVSLNKQLNTQSRGRWINLSWCSFDVAVMFILYNQYLGCLSHWGRVTHICVGNRIIIGSDNGLSPGRRQAIILTNADMLLIGPVGTNFNEILIEIHTFSFKKMHLNMSSGKWRPFCLGLNVLSPASARPSVKVTILLCNSS